MQNPCLEERGSKGAFGRRDTRPINTAWQREKSVNFVKSATGFIGFRAAPGAVDKHSTQPYLCRIASRATTLFLLRFWPLNQGLLNSHSSGEAAQLQT
jgi:hypothetical protein